MLQLKKINLLATENILNKWEAAGYFLKGKGCFDLEGWEKSNLVVLQNQIVSYLPEKQTVWHE